MAITGIGLPIALSYVLQELARASLLQAFSAGAALCSTSLGTTFTILGTTGLTTTRLGTVLTTAAMLDDGVGLIMVQVISDLGASATSFNSMTVVRPVVVSVGLVVALLLSCRFLLKSLTTWLNRKREESPTGVLQRLLTRSETILLIHTAILLGFVTGATYAGTSNLFAAYLAGASISWWDSEVTHTLIGRNVSTPTPVAEKAPADSPPLQTSVTSQHDVGVECGGNPQTDLAKENVVGVSSKGSDTQNPYEPRTNAGALTGRTIYEDYYGAVVKRILKPFFFVSEPDLRVACCTSRLTLTMYQASIGFSIPITQMFAGPVVWRGIVYTVLMALAKLLTGVWLVRFTLPSPMALNRFRPPPLPTWRCWEPRSPNANAKGAVRRTRSSQSEGEAGTNIMAATDRQQQGIRSDSRLDQPEEMSRNLRQDRAKMLKPRSLYPASIIGTAMISRGEIGFLIASVAESKGIFANTSSPTITAQGGSSEIYLIVIWAVILCTIIGPVAVGTLTRRLRKLQMKERKSPTVIDPLGVWGVI